MIFMKRNELIKKLNEILDIDTYKSIDSSLNGMQLGAENREVKIIGFAVDACLETIEKAVENHIDVLIVHHGLYWGSPIAIKDNFYKKIKLLIDNKIDLYAAHLPLDANMEYGNNVAIANKLNLINIENSIEYKGYKLGVVGELKESLNLDEISNKLKFSNPIKLDFNKNIKKIAIVSGEGAHDVHQAKSLGCDLLITGEPRHSEYHYCKEENISMLCGGHYESETFGVKALAVELSKYNNLLIRYIDVPTGI